MTKIPDPSEESKNLARNRPTSRHSFGRETIDRRRMVGSALAQQTIVPETTPLKRAKPKEVEDPSRLQRIQVVLQGSRPLDYGDKGKPPAGPSTKSKASQGKLSLPQVSDLDPLVTAGGEWDPQYILEGMAMILLGLSDRPPSELAARCASSAPLAAVVVKGPEALQKGVGKVLADKKLLEADREWLPDLQERLANPTQVTFGDLDSLADALLENYGTIEGSPPGGSRSHLRRIAQFFSLNLCAKTSPSAPLAANEVRFVLLNCEREQRLDHWMLQGGLPQGTYLYDPWPLDTHPLHSYDPDAPDAATQDYLSCLL